VITIIIAIVVVKSMSMSIIINMLNLCLSHYRYNYKYKLRWLAWSYKQNRKATNSLKLILESLLWILVLVSHFVSLKCICTHRDM